MARNRKRKATDLQPGAPAEAVPGQLELFTLEPEPTGEQPAASVVRIHSSEQHHNGEGADAA